VALNCVLQSGPFAGQHPKLFLMLAMLAMLLMLLLQSLAHGNCHPLL
jgi:hypothetical protein